MTTDFAAMTWNLENLFPAGHQSGPKTSRIFEQKMANLARVILEIAPDVVAVQEVGDPATFRLLQERLDGRYPHAKLASHADPRGIRVGFLSRLALSREDELVDFPGDALTHVTDSQGQVMSQMGRGALKATVEVGAGVRINLVTAHLKSKLITYPGNRRSPRDEDERARETGVALLKRTAEAVALRVFVNDLVLNNAEPLILLGDFNDGPEAATAQLLLGPEDPSLAHPDRFDDIRLYNLADYIPLGHRYSRIYRNQPELIDHIMVSHELIFQHQRVDSFVDRIDSIDQSLGSRREAVFPDHAPVFARFVIA